MKNEYRYGRRKERQIAKQLRRKGYKIKLSKGSRSACDVQACKGSKKWFVQVKATRKKNKTSMSTREKRRLKIQARKNGGVAVHASVSRGKIRYYSTRTRKRLIA